MLKSKTVWTGVAMVVVGLLAFLVPDLGIEADPMQMIGTGLGFVFARLGIAKVKHGDGGGP